MKVKQISVFMENKNGRLADITRLLASRKVSLRAVTIADTVDFGILRLLKKCLGKYSSRDSAHS